MFMERGRGFYSEKRKQVQKQNGRQWTRTGRSSRLFSLIEPVLQFLESTPFFFYCRIPQRDVSRPFCTALCSRISERLQLYIVCKVQFQWPKCVGLFKHNKYLRKTVLYGTKALARQSLDLLRLCGCQILQPDAQEREKKYNSNWSVVKR